MDKKVIAREYVSITRTDLMEDGYWKAVNEIHDKVLYEGETEWVDEEVNAMSMDKDPQSAIKTAMNSSLKYLLQNVYQNGFNGLVEYREFQRQLESKKVEENLDTKAAGN